MSILFLEYPPCSTCQKAKRWLDEHNVSYTSRHIKENNPTAEELTEWYKKSGLPLKKFFNTSGLIYKSMGLKDKLPTMNEADCLARNRRNACKASVSYRRFLCSHRF